MSLTISARFGRVLPLLHDVPGFSGVRIHTGNVIDDTEGCILVGRRISGTKIAESRIAFGKLMATLERTEAEALLRVFYPGRRIERRAAGLAASGGLRSRRATAAGSLTGTKSWEGYI